MEVLTHLAYGRGFLLAIVLIGVAIYWFLKIFFLNKAKYRKNVYKIIHYNYESCKIS